MGGSDSRLVWSVDWLVQRVGVDVVCVCVCVVCAVAKGRRLRR